jgi:hypothetical protein
LGFGAQWNGYAELNINVPLRPKPQSELSISWLNITLTNYIITLPYCGKKIALKPDHGYSVIVANSGDIEVVI